MATIPDRLEEAVEALISKIQAEEATAVVEWVLEDADPVDLTDIGSWVAPSQDLYHLSVLDLAEEGTRETRSPARLQTATLLIRTHTHVWANFGRSLIRHIRKLQNWIEELDDEGRSRGSRQWWIDWKAWDAITDEGGRAPTPGARLRCEITLNQ